MVKRGSEIRKIYIYIYIDDHDRKSKKAKKRTKKGPKRAKKSPKMPKNFLSSTHL